MRLLCLSFVVLLSMEAAAQTPRLQAVAANLNSPIFAAHAPGDADRLFVVQQSGQVVIAHDSTAAPAVFLDIADRVMFSGERGLIGFAFHPDYLTNGFFFVCYSATVSSEMVSRVSRFSAIGDPATAQSADPDSEAIFLQFHHDFSNHNAGMLAFSPNDGYLYIASGDGGSGNDPNQHAQSTASLLGKILRIDVDNKATNTPEGAYSIPADNPFESSAIAKKEIWAYGLRNPWRFGFDRANGDLYIGDVGQNAKEEIDYQPASSAGGENYGWRVFEGTRCNTTVATQDACDALQPNAVFPIHEYNNPSVGRAVTGGYVYRGTLLPNLVGHYFFADSQSTHLWSLKYQGGLVSNFTEWTSTFEANSPPFSTIVSFGQDNAGELYVIAYGGTVFKIVPVPTVHSADKDQNNRINLSEILRVIQIFNSDGYHCAPGSEDGFNPDDGMRLCTAHASDYNPQDWHISLSELLRTIQIYNVEGYTPCAEGEDGFCMNA